MLKIIETSFINCQQFLKFDPQDTRALKRQRKLRRRQRQENWKDSKIVKNNKRMRKYLNPWMDISLKFFKNRWNFSTVSVEYVTYRRFKKDFEMGKGVRLQRERKIVKQNLMFSLVFVSKWQSLSLKSTLQQEFFDLTLNNFMSS